MNIIVRDTNGNTLVRFGGVEDVLEAGLMNVVDSKKSDNGETIIVTVDLEEEEEEES